MYLLASSKTWWYLLASFKSRLHPFKVIHLALSKLVLHRLSFEFHCLPSKLCCLTYLKSAQCRFSSSKTWWYLLASSKAWWHFLASLKFGLNCLSFELDHLKFSKFWCHLLASLNFEWCYPAPLKSISHHFISLKSIIARSKNLKDKNRGECKLHIKASKKKKKKE